MPHQEILPGYEDQWWRAMGVFRMLSVGYAAVLFALARPDYEHVVVGWLVLGALAMWSVLVTFWYQAPVRRGWQLLSADLAVGAGAVIATRFLQYSEAVERGAQTLPVMWVVAPVIAWALVYGWPAAAGASGVVGVANVIERGAVTPPLLHNTMLVAIAGALVGYVAALARRAETQLVHASRANAARRERERLSREVHDGVLQVLAYVTRRGREIGGEAEELARMSAEQEAALRRLIASEKSAEVPTNDREVDLASKLRSFAGRRVTVTVPSGPIEVSAQRCAGVVAAVTAILDNVNKHAGADAHAYVLLDDDEDVTTVTVRDNGAGCPPERLEAAAAEGRIGVRHSIVGRVEDLGGSVHISCREGAGMTVTLAVPRAPVSAVEASA